MSPRSRRPSEDTAMGDLVRTRWLKAMYLANIVVSLPLGTAVLIAPEFMRGILGVPAGDPVHFGIATGAAPFAFGLAGVLGLRSPLRLSPVLAVQATYKSAYLIGVLLPLAVTGQLPGFGIPVGLLFLAFIVGNFIAVPLPYLLSVRPESA